MNNGMSMNQQEFENAFKSFEQLCTKLNDTAQGITSSFSPAVNSGLIKNLGQLTNQVGSISTSVSNMNGSMKQQANEMFHYDDRLAKEADALEIPTDFLKENSTKVNQFNQALVDKMDGKSVNLAEGAKEVSIEDAVTLETSTKEGLFDLSGNTTKEEAYNEKKGAQTALGNISKNSDLSDKDYNSKSGVKEGSLRDITGNQNVKEEEYTNKTGIKQDLGSVSKNSDSSQKEISDAVNIKGQTLGRVSNDINAGLNQAVYQSQDAASKSVPIAGNSNSTKEEQEKANFLNDIMLEQERQRLLKEKQQEDVLEKVDYNDFNQ